MVFFLLRLVNQPIAEDVCTPHVITIDDQATVTWRNSERGSAAQTRAMEVRGILGGIV